jgi:hypothetical protein
MASCAPFIADVPVLGALVGDADSREAELALRRAQLWMLDIYRASITFTGAYRRPPCDGSDGMDCFRGEYECPRCLWSDDMSELLRLGEIYDETAARVADAPERTSVIRLDWLAGQRVGLWARRGELDRARAATDECRGSLWWCEALRGLVDQRLGDYAAAEERFTRVLQLMPAARACYWQEIGMYADTLALSLGHDGYGRLMRELRPIAERPCPDQGDVATFWTLADPLWSVPGNARMAEHYARMTDMHIHQQFLETIDPHGAHLRDHHSVVLRHGWPTGFDWRGAPGAIANRPSLMPRRPNVARVVPPPDPFRSSGGQRLHYGRGQGYIIALPPEDALRAAPEIFDPRDEGGVESYEPPFGPVRPIPLQSGFFRSDGRDMLVVRAAAPAHGGRAADTWQLVAWNGTDFNSADVQVRGDTLTATLDTPWQAQIVSLEAVHADGAWRGRSGTRPPDAAADVALSSVIFIDDAEDEPGQLDDALRRMLPTTRLASGAAPASYWELYASAPVGAAIDVTVRTTARPGLLSRVLGTGPPPELRVRWEELIEPVDGVARRTFDLDLDRLRPGSYQLELVLTLHTGDVLRSDALFVVEP